MLIASAVVLAVAALAYAMKTITEYNNRFDIPNLKSLLHYNEMLRTTLPPYDERMKKRDVLEKKDRDISRTLKVQRLQLQKNQERELQLKRELEQKEIERQYEEMQLREILELS